MMIKKVLKYLGIRIGVLILALIVMIIFLYFAIDPHKNCNQLEHRHNMGQGMAMFIGSGFVISIWFIVLFIEGIMYCIKKEKNTLSFALILLLVLIIVAMAFL